MLTPLAIASQRGSLEVEGSQLYAVVNNAGTGLNHGVGPEEAGLSPRAQELPSSIDSRFTCNDEYEVPQSLVTTRFRSNYTTVMA